MPVTKVLINALSARRGGAKVFVVNLLPALAEVDRNIQYTVILPNSAATYFPGTLPENIQTLFPGELLGARRLWFEHIKIPLMFKSKKYDFYFQADDTLPPLIYLLKGIKLAVLHESLTLLLPETAGDSAAKIAYWKILKWLTLRFVDIPIAVSYCQKGELARGSSTYFKKLQVIYHGINHEIFNVVPKPIARSFSIALPEQYILSISTRNPHKNYYRLIQAYNKLVRSGKISAHLVLIGSPVWKHEEDRIYRYINENNIDHQVHIYNNIHNSELPHIYRRAIAYIYPSLFDSFGFTPLEAMACGTPCAVSLFSALPEICGDAAEYFDPFNIDCISSAIDHVVNNSERRVYLVNAGFRHVKKYNWSKSALKYHSLITSHDSGGWSL